ncbi:NAD(P)/FAD-dependent oxidoreductase [Methylomonas methanica]|uniref:FAD-dependent oxidoreductase n=1 Tax=Methylomonas methanica TaxID=421 RepID=A0A177M5Z9_METMH|nr:FAD-dependent oxidoreductase [Methylomonas methanica]OAI01112.1 FAD-dependent oxidoreductase [Methylomonas methanica]
MQIDVLLIGQGLAGSLLAWELLQRQLRILVVDDGTENASQVAAGLINPVTGQRLVKQVDVETLLPAAMHVYRQLGMQFGQSFYVQMPMLKILRTEKELEIAERRLSQPDYRDYLLGLAPAPAELDAAYGVLQQGKTGYLRTEALLSQLRDVLRSKNCYRRNTLQYGEINLGPALRWHDIYPRHIVFCEGYQAVNNPWFKYLPFQLAKGEILGCESGQDIPKHILNYGHWLIPLESRRFKTGATFDTNQLDNLPTQQAQTALLASLRAVCPQQRTLDVYQHRAGIRPATLDKQPFIGTHPRHSQLHIFNGFGAKGSLAIPWYAARFADYLQQQAGLPSACNIRRYDETHFPA